MQTIFYWKGQFDIGLDTTYKYIDFAQSPQNRNNIQRPAQMAVSRSLYAVQYFHLLIAMLTKVLNFDKLANE